MKVGSSDSNKTIVAEGKYKLRTENFRVKDGSELSSGEHYVICRCEVVNECPDKGKFIELCFSMSMEEVADKWFLAMNIPKDTDMPEDSWGLQMYLNDNCTGALIKCKLRKKITKDGYEQNIVWPITGVKSVLSVEEEETSD